MCAKILVPLSNYNEILPLISSGADEFYCGFLPNDFSTKKNKLNCYYNCERANFTSIEVLKDSVNLIHLNNKKIYVVLNFPNINDQQLDNIKALVKTLLDIKIDAFIIADIGLIIFLNNYFPDIKIHSSTITGAFNHLSIQFLKELNVKRIVLPDHLNKKEIIDLSTSTKNTVMEIFVLNNRCKNIESFCSFEHIGKPNKKHFFKININSLFQKFLLKYVPQNIIKRFLRTNLVEKLIPYEHLNPCKFKYKVSPYGLGNTSKYKAIINRIENSFGIYSTFVKMNRCGACCIYSALINNLNIFKIEGRFNPIEKKIKDVKFIKSCINNFDTKINEMDFIKKCQTVYFLTYKNKCNISKCYYPELWKI
ncbi:MAG: hypothetical protein ACD_79C00311G0003 [uncultured bacterium]|nr:MAG: hypothetical protein ACD_79C00311G0003 [uncultured bacterium]